MIPDQTEYLARLDAEGDYLEAAIQRKILALEEQTATLAEPSLLPELLRRMGAMSRGSW